MNNQEVFDKVVTHLYNQGHSAVVHPTGQRSLCVYRGDNGDMCAIGCLIPDEIYTPAMEQRSFIPLYDSFSTIQDLFKGVDRHLLKSLQEVHDNSMNTHKSSWWNEVKLGLLDIAEDYGLDKTVIFNQ